MSREYFERMRAVRDVDCEQGVAYLLLVLFTFASDKDQAWPSIKRLAACMKVSEETVKLRIRAAKALGFISASARTRENGSSASNVYTLNIDVIAQHRRADCPVCAGSDEPVPVVDVADYPPGGVMGWGGRGQPATPLEYPLNTQEENPKAAAAATRASAPPVEDGEPTTDGTWPKAREAFSAKWGAAHLNHVEIARQWNRLANEFRTWNTYRGPTTFSDNCDDLLRLLVAKCVTSSPRGLTRFAETVLASAKAERLTVAEADMAKIDVARKRRDQAERLARLDAESGSGQSSTQTAQDGQQRASAAFPSSTHQVPDAVESQMDAALQRDQMIAYLRQDTVGFAVATTDLTGDQSDGDAVMRDPEMAIHHLIECANRDPSLIKRLYEGAKKFHVEVAGRPVWSSVK